MEEKFNEAKNYFENGQYKEAISILTPLAENGHINAIKWMIKDSEKQKDTIKLEYYKKLLREVGA